MRALSILFVMAGIICQAAAQLNAAEPQRDRWNIVFIMADDLGYTDLGCYGSRYYETPNIDRLAAQGLRFTNGYTCGPNCQPTRAALMSGQYGPRTGVYTVGSIDRFNWRSRPMKPVDNNNLPLDRITIAQALKSAGYTTGMFGKWHLGDDGPAHPSKRGFDEAIVSAGKHFNFDTRPKTDYPEGAYLADFITDKSLDFIRRHREKPFFLYVAHFAVHSPWEAKPELIAGFKDRPAAGGHNDPTYAAMIASLDESVGRITETLDQLGLSRKTLVIFSSDNGGVGGYTREGLTAANDVTDNAPLRGGKGMLYEGGIRVPYIFQLPGVIEPATSCDEPINSVDLYPTLLNLVGGDAPADYPLDGTSYFKLLTSSGRGRLDRDAIFWHFPGYLGSGQNQWRTLPVGVIRQGDYKLMEFFEDSRLELYNLREDIGEKKNLAQADPGRAKELQKRLHDWRKRIKAPMPELMASASPPQQVEPSERPAGQREPRRARRANRQ